jgi:hypothetical protein
MTTGKEMGDGEMVRSNVGSVGAGNLEKNRFEAEVKLMEKCELMLRR